MTITTIFLLVLGLLFGFFIACAIIFFQRRNVVIQQKQNEMLLFQQELHALREEVARSFRDSTLHLRNDLQSLNQNMNERMKDTTNSLQTTQGQVGARLDSAQKIILELQNKLGSLEESNKRIIDVGQGLKELKDILQSPKLRGNMGEYFLEDLLQQILPVGTFQRQYAFASGEVVDVAIFLGESILPVDSKFPLESFVRLVKIPDDQVEHKAREKKVFLQAIKKHADQIAKKYIRPTEKTFDFAFMYIPAENVYYETIIRDEIESADGSLYSWLLERKVIPVSPNSLYAYMQVILMGLKGLRIQESAKHILQNLNHLSGEFARFQEEFSVLGKHLKNATNSFDGSSKRFDKLQDRYDRIQALQHTDTIKTDSIKIDTLENEQLSLGGCNAEPPNHS